MSDWSKTVILSIKCSSIFPHYLQLRFIYMRGFLTVAAVEVCVGAGSAVLWSHVDLGVKVLRHGGVTLLTGGLLGV